MSKKILLVILLVIVIILSLSLFLVKESGRNNQPQQNVVPENLPGIQMTEIPWKAERDHLRERLKIIGLPALSGEGVKLHTHHHIDIFISGEQVTIPAEIGIGEGFISPIHTHDETSVIHVESAQVQIVTLGQFFDIWGVRFVKDCIGAYCESGDNKLRVFVNGVSNEGDPRSLELSPYQEIVVAFGTDNDLPNPIPSSYQFDPGL